MAHDGGDNSHLLSLHCDGVQQVIERGLLRDCHKANGILGNQYVAGFVLHCDGVEQVMEKVLSVHTHQAANKAFLSSYVTRTFTLVNSSSRHRPTLQSN
jgi:hypothetical protein